MNVLQADSLGADSNCVAGSKIAMFTELRNIKKETESRALGVGESLKSLAADKLLWSGNVRERKLKSDDVH